MLEKGRAVEGLPVQAAGQTGVSSGRYVERVEEEVSIGSPVEAVSYLQEKIFCPIADCDQEELWVLLMSTKNRVTHQVLVYRGVVNGAQVRVAEVFKHAVGVNAPAIIVAHCHPSGDPEPSAEDIRVTRQLVEAGQLLDIEVLDHVIIGGEGYASLRERGLGFSGVGPARSPPERISEGESEERTELEAWPISSDTTPLFSLGQIVATPGALALCAEAGVRPTQYLSRHVSGDWGLVDPEDGEANEAALVRGGRVLSAYVVPGGQRIWIITEADRSATTLLLPSES